MTSRRIACRTAARLREAASYHRASADDLGDVEANVVTTRSVLIYVADKQRAFDEFFRVLLPGGRLSIFEPINRFGLQERRPPAGSATSAKRTAVREGDRRNESRRAGRRRPDRNDRLRRTRPAHLRRGGGARRHPLDTDRRGVQPRGPPPRDWSVFLDSSPNPLAPTVGEAMREALTTTEQDQLTQVIRPQVEQGLGHTELQELS